MPARESEWLAAPAVVQELPGPGGAAWVFDGRWWQFITSWNERGWMGGTHVSPCNALPTIGSWEVAKRVSSCCQVVELMRTKRRRGIKCFPFVLETREACWRAARFIDSEEERRGGLPDKPLMWNTYERDKFAFCSHGYCRGWEEEEKEGLCLSVTKSKAQRITLHVDHVWRNHSCLVQVSQGFCRRNLSVPDKTCRLL